MFFDFSNQREILLKHWQTLGESLACNQQMIWQKTGLALIKNWSSFLRRYHNLEHLSACLEHFSNLQNGIYAAVNPLKNPQSAALALWFHDAIYVPWRKDNEEQSAKWATEFLSQLNFEQNPHLSLELQRDVAMHILATRHGFQSDLNSNDLNQNVNHFNNVENIKMTENLYSDTDYILDIDLAILGARSEIYDSFEHQIRAEYFFVPKKRYRKARSAILQSFLNRPRLYKTDIFHERFDSNARQNLKRALLYLK